MTKQEAINAMNEGKKVQHRYFSDSEWMMKGGKGYIFEDGVSCEESYFWKDRNDKFWDNDWSIIQVIKI